MNTPAVLIRDISLTPNALTSVVNTMSTVASSTALLAKLDPVPSPMTWKTLEICGSVSW